MRVKIIVIKDNGEELEFSRELGSLDSSNVLNSVESEVDKLQGALSPFLSEALIEDHQKGFVGEKNPEEKRDT